MATKAPGAGTGLATSASWMMHGPATRRSEVTDPALPLCKDGKVYKRAPRYLQVKGYGWRQVGRHWEVFKFRPWSSRTQQDQEASVVPSAKVFFNEVRAVYASTADALDLTGPEETEQIMPRASYKAAFIEYWISLDYAEGTVGCRVKTETDTIMLTVDIEPLAVSTGVAEKCGAISYSARNQKQLRKSLQGHAEYVQRVHQLLIDSATAESVMRQAGAREWEKRAEP
ncbi:hypothetical protein ACIQVL_51280 [Streptomyces sp. NPDC090499]|uniref:hypothetical protein n=1 Tax=Streptomyces sp. NPDC090499 TaxID=3365965 RepID=UPI0038174B87